MHPDNGFYGHDMVLRAFAGLPAGTPLRAHIQHGWGMGTGLSAPRRLVSWLPRFVWSSRNIRRAADLGVGRVSAIGAPFLYLDEPTAVEPASRSTIFYPYHGSEWNKIDGSHHRLAAEIGEREDPSTTIGVP